MTAHELARLLLTMPDVPVTIYSDDGVYWSQVANAEYVEGEPWFGNDEPEHSYEPTIHLG